MINTYDFYRLRKRMFFCTALLFSIVASSQVAPESYTREWGTYFGGLFIGGTFLNIDEDENGNLWVAGPFQDSPGAPDLTPLITEGAHQPVYGGNNDGYLLKFSPEGELLYGTYFGGGGSDLITSMDVKDGFVYITGETTSETSIATPGSFQEEIAANTDPNGDPYPVRASFIAQFDLSGELQWSTYYQGNRHTILFSIAAGNDGDVFVWGMTASGDMATPGAFKEEIPLPYQVGPNSFVAPGYPILAKFDVDGQLQWATYYGPDIDGEGDEGGGTQGGLTVDAAGSVYVGGAVPIRKVIMAPSGRTRRQTGEGRIFFSVSSIHRGSGNGVPITVGQAMRRFPISILVNTTAFLSRE